LLTCIRWAGRNIHARDRIPADKWLQQENIAYWQLGRMPGLPSNTCIVYRS